jgi:endonuclease-3
VPRESLQARRARVQEILRRLKDAYPDSQISLAYQTEFQLLVSVILSAQCTDARVNLVTKELFKKYRTVDDFANADPKTFQREIFSTGFYRNKTKSVLGAARAIRDRFGGQVPRTLEELDSVPGVARKTANVVLWNAFRTSEGIAVDTHVTRLAHLLRLSRKKDPVKIEQDLMRVVPQDQWGQVTHYLIDHGRAVCVARRPRCEACVLNDLCPSALRPVTQGLVAPADATARSSPLAPLRGRQP